VAALLLAREDRQLGLEEKLALRLHLAAAMACPLFAKQVLTLRSAFASGDTRRTRANGDDPRPPGDQP
jgi:hypothetical protein